MAYRLSPWSTLMECLPPRMAMPGGPEAEVFVQSGVHRLLDLLADTTRTALQRAGAFRAAVRRLADVSHVMNRVLGPRGQALPPDQRRRLALAFGAYAARAYDGRPWPGRAGRVTILDSTQYGPGEVVVAFAITSGREAATTQMAWRVWKSVDGWRLVDVKHRGTWLVDAHRRALGVAIRDAGDDIEALIGRLHGGTAGARRVR